MLRQHRRRRHRTESLASGSQTGEHRRGSASACSPFRSSRGISQRFCAFTQQLPWDTQSMAHLLLCFIDSPSLLVDMTHQVWSSCAALSKSQSMRKEASQRVSRVCCYASYLGEGQPKEEQPQAAPQPAAPSTEDQKSTVVTAGPWYAGKERGTKLSQSRVLSEREMEMIELGGALD